MADVNVLVEKAIIAYKAKQKSVARDLLLKAVDLDEHHEQGWLYLSLVVDSLNEQKTCLENVLAINPNNAQAKKALTVVRQKLGEPETPAAPPPPSYSRPAEETGWGDIDVQATWSAFSGSGPAPLPPTASPPPAAPKPASSSSDASWFDNMPWGTAESDPAITGAKMDFSAPALDPSKPATSVDWGKSDDSAGYHGSGRQVDTFSSNELDSWISGLPINSENAAPKASSEIDDWASAVAADVSVTEGPFGSAPRGISPFTTLDLDAPQSAETAKASPPPKAAAPPKPAMPVLNDNEFMSYDDPFGDTTTTTPEDPFFDADALEEIGAIKPQPRLPGMEFYMQIPDEIQVPVQEVKSSGSLFGVLLLVILNLAALAGVAINMVG